MVGRDLYGALLRGYRALMDSLIEVSLWLLEWTPALLVWGLVLLFPARWVWKKLRARSAAVSWSRRDTFVRTSFGSRRG